MKSTFTLLLAAVLFAATTSQADPTVAGTVRAEPRAVMPQDREAKKEELKAKHRERKTEIEQKRAEYRQRVKQETAVTFEKKNSDKDLLRGNVTYSMPSKDGESDYVAFIMLRWGDLDNQIPDIKPEYYSNWDGYVKVQEAGKASVIKEFAFDDRNDTTGGGNNGGIGRDSGRRPARPGEPGEGSGIDMIIKDSEPSMVAWKSGIVGATDGLLIKLELKKPEAKGSIKAGNFTIPYEIKPRAN